MIELHNPLNSLKEGHWFKLICGASFQHLPAVRNLTLAYTLAGADCIDVAADPAVIAAAIEGMQAAKKFVEAAQCKGYTFSGLPWLMVSLNDGEDPHFRKAEFNASLCPSDCPRPCEKICPAQAIAFNQELEGFSGVSERLCYGCGRCVPVCPQQIIFTRSYVSTPAAIAPLILQSGIDALEIHTQVGHLEDFKRLWSSLAPWADRLKLLAISCPDDEGTIDYLWELYNIIKPLPCALVWQTDGRPMSGDIGAGTTHAAVRLGQKVLAASLPGYVQLAGGTNSYTVAKLKSLGLLKKFVPSSSFLVHGNQLSTTSNEQLTKNYISGIAYGSYARVLMLPVLEELEKLNTQEVYVHDSVERLSAPRRLEESPILLWQAVEVAHSLVSQIKSVKSLPQPVPK